MPDRYPSQRQLEYISCRLHNVVRKVGFPRLAHFGERTGLRFVPDYLGVDCGQREGEAEDTGAVFAGIDDGAVHQLGELARDG